MTYGVGIDLGSTSTAAAVNLDGNVEMVRLGDRATVPSMAYLDPEAGMVTGDRAGRLALQFPGRAAGDLKRRLGDPTPITLGGVSRSPAALMAELLADALHTVTEHQGAPPDRVVLTCPASWGPYRREQFASVPRLVGPSGSPAPDGSPGSPHAGPGDMPDIGSGDRVQLVSEPVAAAVCHAARNPLPPDGVLAVYDLGGGTFDSAVVRNGSESLQIVGVPEGVHWFGGADLDQAVLDRVDQAFAGAVSALDPHDAAGAAMLARLRHECRRAKEALTVRPETTLTVTLPGAVHRMTLCRTDFEQMITPRLQSTIQAVRRSLVASGTTPEELVAVLLVGGCSQIPLVRRLLREAFGCPVVSTAHPQHAVALGAARLAAAPISARRTVVRPRGPAPVESTPVEPGPVAPGPVEPPPVRAGPVRPAAESGGERAPEVASSAAHRARSWHLLTAFLVLAGLLVLPVAVRAAHRGSSSGPPPAGGERTATLPPGRPTPTATATPGAAQPGSARPGSTPAQPPAGPTEPAPTVLLSRGRPVAASSAGAGVLGPRAAVDGRPDTRWTVTAGGPQWLRIDLGGANTVTEVSLDWADRHPAAFHLQLSDDAAHWADVHVATVGHGGVLTVPISGTGRYLRVYATGTTAAGISLGELRVLGRTGIRPGACADVDRALRRPAIASSSEQAQLSPGRAVDGDPVTRWVSRRGGPQWLRIDLGSSMPVCRVTVDWERAATVFRLQVSVDGRGWLPLRADVPGVRGVQVLVVKGTGRYLRVSGIGRPSRGFSVRELVVNPVRGS